jgi:hypothetical protein
VFDRGVAANEQGSIDGRSSVEKPLDDRIGHVRGTHPPPAGIGVVDPDYTHDTDYGTAA